MHHLMRGNLMRGILSSKCIVGLFCHYANIIERTYINEDGRAFFTPRQYGKAYLSYYLIKILLFSVTCYSKNLN